MRFDVLVDDGTFDFRGCRVSPPTTGIAAPVDEPVLIPGDPSSVVEPVTPHVLESLDHDHSLR